MSSSITFGHHLVLRFRDLLGDVFHLLTCLSYFDSIKSTPTASRPLKEKPCLRYSVGQETREHLFEENTPNIGIRICFIHILNVLYTQILSLFLKGMKIQTRLKPTATVVLGLLILISRHFS